MDYRKNIISGGVLMLAALFYFVNAFSIRVFSGLGKSVIDSSTMPKIWGVCLFLLSFTIFIRGIKEMKAAKALLSQSAGTKFSLTNSIRENYAVIGTFIILAIYILLLNTVGFIIMTAIYLFCQILILTQPQKRRVTLTAGIAVVFSLAIYFLFVKALYIILPGGLLPL